MFLALQTNLSSADGVSSWLPAQEADPRLEISVVFTSVRGTIVALKRAARLADQLGARITLVVPQIVPFPAPLTSPPVLTSFNEQRCRLMAEKVAAETRVEIYLCREPNDTLEAVLRRRSLVVLGGCRRLWPTREKRLANRLRQAGHEVIFADSE
jgi:hypothetical protein